ncbi:MAG: PAC2 family protein [Methanomassiliicoccaceae archaeon]|nr:PAC2 family protein [Methanomassiliicoccaceae archaeon]
MPEFAVHKYKDMNWKDTIAVVGFPSVGLVSSIAASFLARSLDLEVIGGISSSEFPPYAVVQNGVPYPPVRIYGGNRDCEDDRGVDCDGLVVITSEFLPKIEQHHTLAVSILDWLDENCVATVICLDGIPQFDNENKILGIASTPAARDVMMKYSIEGFDDGLVRGMSGIMLSEGAMRGMDVLAILGTARTDMPDPRGAARLMEPLTRMIPELKIDTEPLYKEAEDIEKRIETNSGSLSSGNKDFLYG